MHYSEDFLEYVKRESKRREVKEAEVIREIIKLGLPKYKQLQSGE